VTVGLEDWRPNLHGTATTEEKNVYVLGLSRLTHLLNPDIIPFT